MSEDARSRPGGGGEASAGGNESGERSRRPDARPGRDDGPDRESEVYGEVYGGRFVSSGPRGRLDDLGRWVTLTGDRSALVALLTLSLFGCFVGLGLAGVVDVSRAQRVTTAFSTSITGLFTLVTITVSINQLVLSRVLGSPEHIQERIDSVESFRDSVAEESQRVMVPPTEPAAFLEVVTRALRTRACRLEEVFDHEDPQLLGDVSRLVDELVDLAQEVDEQIHRDRLSLFGVLLPVLGNRYSDYVHTVERLRETTDDLSPAEERALADLHDVLVEVNRTRHYFKTLYLHEALSSLSLLILLTGVGAVVLCYVVILSYSVPPGGAGTLHLVAVSASLAVVLSPLSVLFSYGARVARIASRTTTFGTFTPVEEFQ